MTKVYVIDLDKTNFDFRSHEHMGDIETIKKEATRLNDVYALDEFQDLVNDEELLLDNSFILIAEE